MTEICTGSLTEKMAVAVANWILRTFAPTYSKFIQATIHYGLRSAAEERLNK